MTALKAVLHLMILMALKILNKLYGITINKVIRLFGLLGLLGSAAIIRTIYFKQRVMRIFRF